MGLDGGRWAAGASLSLRDEKRVIHLEKLTSNGPERHCCSFQSHSVSTCLSRPRMPPLGFLKTSYRKRKGTWGNIPAESGHLSFLAFVWGTGVGPWSSEGSCKAVCLWCLLSCEVTDRSGVARAQVIPGSPAQRRSRNGACESVFRETLFVFISMQYIL